MMNRECQNCKVEFTIEKEDQEFYRKIEVPAPTFCWLCRAQRRLLFRNERALYPRTSSMSGDEIYSTYPADVLFPVYTQKEWFSDGWDPLDYGREYDFSKSFFDQYYELWKVVPRPAKSVIIEFDSDFTNNCTELKNCYLVFNTSGAEDCAYGNAINYSRNAFDNSHCRKLELAYENFWGLNSSKVFYCSQFAESTDIYFSKNMRGCNNCFGCVGLRGKSYCFFNEQLTKEEYQQRVGEYDLGSYKDLQRALKESRGFWKKFPCKYLEGMRNTDVSGGYISMSKNVKDSYLVVGGEDLRYCQYMEEVSAKDAYDHTIWGQTNFSYECAIAGELYNGRFCLQTWSDVRNVEYVEYCQSSANLFGCISVRNKQYCILNKQYTKEEYERLVPKIRKQMREVPYKSKGGHQYLYGEFFPPEFSPFGYNETLAQEHFPLKRNEVLARGMTWEDVERKAHTIDVPHDQIPDNVKDVGGDILRKVLGCEHNGECNHDCVGAFRIIPQELNFLKSMNVALPRLCVNCRHRERISQRNPIRLYESSCMCAGVKSRDGVYTNIAQHFHGAVQCDVEFKTTFKPDSDNMIYCEQCYNAEMV